MLKPIEYWNALQPFIDPETYMLYDYPEARDTLPTVEQVLDDVPNPCSWASGFEDCALNGGYLLPYLIAEYENSGEAVWHDAALRTADAMLHLATVSQTRGFLPRGVLPDNRTYARNSSVDQYTMIGWGLLALWRWEAAGEERRAVAAQFVADAMQLMERHNWQIPTADEKVGWVGETSHFFRLLQFAVTDYAMNPCEATLARYRSLRDADCGRRTRAVAHFSVMIPYALLQTQVSLRVLYELEPDEAFRQVWRNNLYDMAEHAMSRFEALDLAATLQQIKDLAYPTAFVPWESIYDDANYRQRRNHAGVTRLCIEPFYRANPQLDMEQEHLRASLEYFLCYHLAGQPELQTLQGRLLNPVVAHGQEVICSDVPVSNLQLVHNLVSLLALAIGTEKTLVEPEPSHAFSSVV